MRNYLLLVAILGLLLPSMVLPAMAQSERYPNSREMGILKRKFSQLINSVKKDYLQDVRTQKEKRDRQSLVKVWSKKTPSIAPFLGEWQGYEESLSIYPSKTQNRVCLIWAGITDEETFVIGNFLNGEIRGSDRKVIFRQGYYLGTAIITKNKPELNITIPLHSPRPLKLPKQSIRQFNQAGCTASPPAQK